MPPPTSTTRQVEVLVDFATASSSRSWRACMPKAGSKPDSTQALTMPASRRGQGRRQGLRLARLRDNTLHKVGLVLGERDRAAANSCLQRRPGERATSCVDGLMSSWPTGCRRRLGEVRQLTAVQEHAMFLSDFSIKRPVTTVVIIIMLMCLGLLALNKLRVNQIPDVEQPVIVVDIPYPGRLARDRRARDHQPHRKAHAEHSRGLPDPLDAPARAARSIVIMFDFKKNMIEAADEMRNAIAAVRYKLPVEMREPILQRIDPSAQPIMQLALSSTTQSHAEISRLAEDVLADRFRAIDGVATVNVDGSLQARAVGAAARREAARVQRLGRRGRQRAARCRTPPRRSAGSKGALEEQSIRLVGRIESPAEFDADRRQAQRRRDRAPGPGGRRSRTASPSSPASACATATRTWACRSPARATRAPSPSPSEVRDMVDEINKTLPARHASSRSPTTAARTRRTACNNVDRRADVRRRC